MQGLKTLQYSMKGAKYVLYTVNFQIMNKNRVGSIRQKDDLEIL